MAEKITSSQESLPMSEESCLHLLSQLGSPFQHLLNEIEPVLNSPSSEYPPLEPIPIPNAMEPRSQYMLEDNMQVQKRIPSSLPATENWPGDFGFKVGFKHQENVKGVQWVFSNLRNKLYVGKDVPCPINFSTTAKMPDDVCIRAMALFSSADQASEIVHRCMNHSMGELILHKPEAEHLIRSECSSAVYAADQNTGRHSVVVPYENPPAGQDFSTYIYKFACFGSCSGGPNRRPLMLVFTLEKGGIILGRQTIQLKICACPLRDYKADEKTELPKIKNKEAPKPAEKDVPSLKRKNLNSEVGLELDTVDDVPNFHRAVKKMRIPEKKGPYTITVEDKKCYDFLKMMRNCFQLYFNKSDEKIYNKKHLINFFLSNLSSSEEEQ